jgi:DNA-binding IclR family transcriptional regulator
MRFLEGQLLKTVNRALKLLFILGANPDGLNLSELAKAGCTNKQDVFRLVKTLTRFQFVQTDAKLRKVTLGPGILTLAEMVKPQLDLRQISVPLLTKLRDDTGETACLHFMIGDKRMCAVQVESRDELRCVANIGEELPLTTGAPGRVFLAYLPEQERNRLLAHIGRATKETVTDKYRLNRMIAATRRNGFTIARNETVHGMAAVSAPVFGASGQMVAAITILGPSPRLTKGRLNGHSSRVCEAARRLSTVLGHASRGSLNLKK